MRVLLVEDNLIIGEALRDHVAADGWDVDWSIDLQSAIKTTDLRDYAVILLDLHLPDGNGLDLLRHLGRRSLMPSVIILSAYDQFSDRAEGMKLGAVDYLVKPFDLDEMITRIGRLEKQREFYALAGRSPYPAAQGRPARSANNVASTKGSRPT